MYQHKKLFFVLLLAVICQSAAAQHENDTWYFGYKTGLTFQGGTSYISHSNTQDLNISACISDKNTGNLLFYTNGLTVWDKNNNVMPGGNNINTSTGSSLIIVPFPGSPGKYYILSNLNTIVYAIVDMSLNGGLGQVTATGSFPASPGLEYMCVVKHAYNNSYWLIGHRGSGFRQFLAYNLSEAGWNSTPVISTIGPEPTSHIYGIVTSNDGKKIALSYYLYDSAVDASGRHEVFTFDKTCGTVSSPIILKKNDNLWHTYNRQLCFSPDNSKLYASYQIVMANQRFRNILVQYSGPYFSQVDTVAEASYRRFYDIRLGPDNKIYILPQDTSMFGMTDNDNVDVIEYPDKDAKNVSYRSNYLQLDQIKYYSYSFPNFITDRSTPGPNPDNPGLDIKVTGICPGDSTRFSILPPFFPDSVTWDFGDTTSPSNTSTSLSPAHLYPDSGMYTVTVHWYKCYVDVKQEIKVKIQDFKDFSLGPDTVFCYKGNILLNTNITGANYLWSTGSTDPSITVTASGNYWLSIESGGCKNSDSITVKELQPILIELGGAYAICDDDNELVELDAGKGFERYKWTPTGDTNQWIIVRKAGDYFVVVEDFRGCKGDDGAVVYRLCDFVFHLPTAFTPNHDGLNDIFTPTFSDVFKYTIEIYTTWGEKIFESNDPTLGWDGTYKGKPAPQGSYVWKVKFKGYQNKVYRNYNRNGVVTLLR